MRLTLEQYLNQLGWSQAQCAREADVSVTVVARVLNHERINRKSAERLVNALNQKLHEQGSREYITLESIDGLVISNLRREKKSLLPDK